MSVSRRYDMVLNIAERLAAIRVANGFNTDAGLQVLLGELPMFGDDDPPEALTVIIGTDQVTSSMENVASKIPFEIQALVKVGSRSPLLALESMIADIKKAIETQDRSLGGTLIRNGLSRFQTRVLEREPGSNFVGVGVDYVGTIAEKWGNP